MPEKGNEAYTEVVLDYEKDFKALRRGANQDEKNAYRTIFLYFWLTF